MSRLPSITPTSISRTGSLEGSNQLVTQAVYIQAVHTARRSTSVSAAPRCEVRQQLVRELRHGEDVDEVEEELDRRDTGIVVAPRAHEPCVRGQCRP